VNPPTTESQLEVFDLSNPTQPVKVGNYRTPDVVWGLQGLGPLLYAAVGSAGIEVYDVTDPPRPVKVGSYRTRAAATGVQVVGNRVYALTGPGGMAILEVVPDLRLDPPVVSGTALTLSWNGSPGIKLQKAASLTNPDWQDVAGSEGASQIELPRDAAAAFFRLIQP
jgi:hypothetical protein